MFITFFNNVVIQSTDAVRVVCTIAACIILCGVRADYKSCRLGVVALGR